ncbi:hypothetical protein AX16_001123 [Volvariella volvacea WC 439]|nr:hypothetical protein AX16_001123 [Volvariella volvacea WC 439]
MEPESFMTISQEESVRLNDMLDKLDIIKFKVSIHGDEYFVIDTPLYDEKYFIERVQKFMRIISEDDIPADKQRLMVDMAEKLVIGFASKLWPLISHPDITLSTSSRLELAVFMDTTLIHVPGSALIFFSFLEKVTAKWANDANACEKVNEWISHLRDRKILDSLNKLVQQIKNRKQDFQCNVYGPGAEYVPGIEDFRTNQRLVLASCTLFDPPLPPSILPSDVTNELVPTPPLSPASELQHSPGARTPVLPRTDTLPAEEFEQAVTFSQTGPTLRRAALLASAFERHRSPAAGSDLSAGGPSRSSSLASLASSGSVASLSSRALSRESTATTATFEPSSPRMPSSASFPLNSGLHRTSSSVSIASSAPDVRRTASLESIGRALSPEIWEHATPNVQLDSREATPVPGSPAPTCNSRGISPAAFSRHVSPAPADAAGSPRLVGVTPQSATGRANSVQIDLRAERAAKRRAAPLGRQASRPQLHVMHAPGDGNKENQPIQLNRN